MSSINDRDKDGLVPEQFRKLFIGGLSKIVKKEDLEEYFSKYGEITDAVVICDRNTKISKGFGFVTFQDPASVDNVQEERPHTIANRDVECKRAMPREEANSPEAHVTINKMYIGNIGKDITEEDLSEYFSSYGTIDKCDLCTEKDTGESKGFAFIIFKDYDAVDKAILYRPHEIKNVKAHCRKYISKEMKQQLQERLDGGRPSRGRETDSRRYGDDRSMSRYSSIYQDRRSLYDRHYESPLSYRPYSTDRMMSRSYDDRAYDSYYRQADPILPDDRYYDRAPEMYGSYEQRLGGGAMRVRREDMYRNGTFGRF